MKAWLRCYPEANKTKAWRHSGIAACESDSGFVSTSCSFWRSVSTGTYSTAGMIVEAAMATGRRCKLEDSKMSVSCVRVFNPSHSALWQRLFEHRLLFLNKESQNQSSQWRLLRSGAARSSSCEAGASSFGKLLTQPTNEGCQQKSLSTIVA